MNKIETYYRNIIRGLNDGYVILECPVAYFKGKMVLFTESESADEGHRFGGHLPEIINTLRNARLHMTLNINTSSCDLFADVNFKSIPLIYPFQHDGGSIQYFVKNDSKIQTKELNPPEYTTDWPYENYPEYFREVNFCCSHPFDISESKFESILPQGLWNESGNEIVVIIPPSREYGESLWGEMGDDEGVLCVFYINNKTGLVRAGNQCS